MPLPRTLRVIGALALGLPLAFCGGGEPSDEQSAEAAPSGPAAGHEPHDELTESELDQGIGPIRDLVLGEVDPALATEGEAAFVLKCSACHQIEQRYVGPRLGTVLARHRPEYVMNMMLNADEMVQRHPFARELLGQFYTPMPVQVTEESEARAILEYLRTVQLDTINTEPGDGHR